MTPSEKRKQREAAKRLVASIQPATRDGLERNRVISFGGAAVMLAVVLQILQVAPLTVPLKISVIAAAVAMPMLLGPGIIIEYYFRLGDRGYVHFGEVFFGGFMKLYSVIAYLAFAVAIAGVIFHISPLAMYIFLAACIGVTIVCSAISGVIARDFFAETAPPGAE
jgi:hypothetical protein